MATVLSKSNGRPYPFSLENGVLVGALVSNHILRSTKEIELFSAVCIVSVKQASKYEPRIEKY